MFPNSRHSANYGAAVHVGPQQRLLWGHKTQMPVYTSHHIHGTGQWSRTSTVLVLFGGRETILMNLRSKQVFTY